MVDRTFPEFASHLPHAPDSLELVVPRQPLLPIFQALGISVHDLVNDRRHHHRVRDLYRITRRIEAEGWLRRQLERIVYDAWIDAHL